MPATKVVDEAELDLVEQAQGGDRQAFSELVTRHYKGVINVVYRMSGDINLAEDMAQEAFIRAWKSLHTYRPKSPFRNWLYRIAANAALDVFRREKDMLDIDELQLPTANGGPEKALESKEQTEIVRQAVLDLPPASRSVLVLREYEGFSYQEIADTLDIPMGTVMSRLNYARKTMRASLLVLLEAA